MPGPERPRWLFLVIGGPVYASALLGMRIARLAGQPDVQDLAAGPAAAVTASLLSFAIQAHKKFGTLDPRDLAEFKG